MLKDIFQSFLPWFAYFILASYFDQHISIAIIAAAIITIAFDFKELRKGFILSWGTFIYFIFLFIAAVVFKNPWVIKYHWLLSNSTLALIAWVSLLIRKPFTIQYAKEQVSSDKWQHPLFLKINNILTAVWGIIFFISVMLNVSKIYLPEISGTIYNISTYLPSIFGVWFTSWFSNWYREKYLAQLK